MNIKLPNKITDRELDEFINRIYQNYQTNPIDFYYFDFTEVEFIANQELLVFSALLKSFFDSGVEFKVLFFKEGIPSDEISSRVKKQIIQLFEVWHIWKIVPDGSYYKYFGIDRVIVQRMQRKLGYYPRLSEIYNRHGVTPFISLDFINNYNEVEIHETIEPIFRLNSAIEELLFKDGCQHPFTSNSLSIIITEELYLNFLDHSQSPSFPKFQETAFMSISFHAKIDEEKYTSEEIQMRKGLNFRTECLEETLNFFYDSQAKSYRNIPYIQLSFLDFGQGIAETLKQQFQTSNETRHAEKIDSDILRYAFDHSSSRHPILDQKNRIEKFIPRGLFDVISIVRRYKGLLIARSNFGKILFDFTIHNDLTRSFAYFGNDKLFFPGTLITFYIPALADISKLDVSSIKPDVRFSQLRPVNKKYVSLNAIASKLQVEKMDLYNKLLHELKSEICDSQNQSLVFLSFKGCDIDRRLIKKTLYFLLTDYDINYRNNVVILNSPEKSIVNEISSEILALNESYRNYKLHPLPIIDFDENNLDLNITWLGIYHESDKVILNDLLYDQYSITRSDFIDPSNISGHLNEFDSYGNLISNFPSRNDIISYYREENTEFISRQIQALLEKHTCIRKAGKASLYLCSGNYYQREYVELNNLLNDKNDCKTITKLLYAKLKQDVDDLRSIKYIGITTTSNKLLKALESQKLITRDDYIFLDNQRNFEVDLNEDIIDASKKYVLVCDVISTGSLTVRLNSRLLQLGTRIEYVAVVISILDPSFSSTKEFLQDYEGRILYLYKHPIAKLTRKDLGIELFSKELIRINPHTSIPVRLSIKETKYNESIIFHSAIEYIDATNRIQIRNKFLDSINSDVIRVGFLKFNNVIHPYFFNTDRILREFSQNLLKEILVKIGSSEMSKERIQVFYPRKSGMDHFNFRLLKSVLKNQLIEEIEIERFGTPEGWRFPHNTDYLSAKIENTFCLILDDGSCSGDSLIQMIDEIAFYDAKEIVLLCLIGRIDDHKREFYSRISNITVKNGKIIPISINFVSHWHIPTYYLDENPNIKETLWLNEVISIQNTPQSIRKIAKSIMNEITPKSEVHFKDYKYLPRCRDTKKIPKKELLIIREELGKVIGYRLYKESFVFFDCFIKKYQKKPSAADHYKEIELLCAAFIYEPYLYDKIIGVLPDIVERVQGFVKGLIFHKKDIYNNLSYEWDKKDIVHLFFIAFKDEKLIKELTKERFKQLLEFTQELDSTTNYVLYKLLRYFPLNTTQFASQRFDTPIRELIYELKDDETIPIKEIRKYYNFITSLPSREDFASQLSHLKQNYAKQKEQEFHDEKKSFNHNVSELIVTIREIAADVRSNRAIGTTQISTIRKCWFKILEFIKPILSFSSSFKEFLLPYTFYELVNQANSLREMVGFVEDIILADSNTVLDLEKLEIIKSHVIRIQINYELNSIFHQVIENHQSDLLEVITLLKEEIAKSFKIKETERMPPVGKKNLNIPRVYFEKLLIAELITNMKKYAKGGDENIVLSYSMLNSEQFELKIMNDIISVNSKLSNGEGLKCLRLMSDSAIFGFKFISTTIDKTIFVQKLIFNIR